MYVNFYFSLTFLLIFSFCIFKLSLKPMKDSYSQKKLFITTSLLLVYISTAVSVAIEKKESTTTVGSSKGYLCQSKELNNWNAIIFESFNAKGSNSKGYHGIDGPLIVGSDANINDYYINGNYNGLCTSEFDQSVPINEYGLVLGGLEENSYKHKLEDVLISGAIQVNGINNTDHIINGIERVNSNCRLVMSNGLKQRNSRLSKKYQKPAKSMSMYLSMQPATHILSKNGKVKSIKKSQGESEFHVFNFAICPKSGQCDIPSDGLTLSNPTEFLNGVNEWKGANWPENKVIVFNIPVMDTHFELKNQHDIMNGLSACRTIWNFFTVDSNGEILKDSQGLFTLDRSTKSIVGGTILAVDGTVRDGPTGGFGGQLIANKYTWLDKTRGVSIRDFSAFDEQCPTLTASCWPRLSKTESTAEKADFSKKERKENSAIKMHEISFLDLINNDEEEVKYYSDKISYSTLISTDVTPVTQVVQKPKTSTLILPGKVITVTKFLGNSAPSVTLASPISSAKPLISTKSNTQLQASSAIESKVETHVKDESLNAMKLLNFMDLDVSEELNSDDNVTLNNDNPTRASTKSQQLTSSSNTISSITKPSSSLSSGSFSSLSQLNSPLADIGYNSQRHKIMVDLSNIASSFAKADIADDDEAVNPISVSASIEQKSISQEEEAITTSVEDAFAQKTFTVAAVPTAYTYDVVNNNLIPLF